MIHFRSTLTLAAAMTLTLAAGTSQSAESNRAPNIVIIMVDDMGFSDLGCYGSEIDTPHLDRLADDGLRFTQFYNTGRCCPTRASLLTGLYPHQAGIGHMTGGHRGLPAYQGYLNSKCVTIAELLRQAGYYTAISGKWHVGSAPGQWPLDRGFDRFYGIPQGGGHHYRMLPGRFLVLDDEQIETPDDWYSTTAFTDYAIEFLSAGAAEKRPVFLYVAYTAPHWPLQAPDEVIEKFTKRYRVGWQAIREQRFERQRELGLFPKGTKLSKQHSRTPKWSSTKNKDEMIRRMATHAAMMHLVDEGVGRIVDRLRELGQLDNTLILFLSDNGASAESGATGFVRKDRGDPSARTGMPDSYVSFGIAGANVSDAPFRRFKMEMHEGGIATPLIAHWPAAISQEWRGEFVHDPGHVIDLLPTCIDLAGVDYPSAIGKRKIVPAEGVSLRPALLGESIARGEPLFFEHQGNRAIRDGDWKLVATGPRGAWELYNLSDDRTETNNLAAEHPERVAELAAKWEVWAKRAGVKPWPWK